jgi:hypothetical protein
LIVITPVFCNYIQDQNRFGKDDEVLLNDFERKILMNEAILSKFKNFNHAITRACFDTPFFTAIADFYKECKTSLDMFSEYCKSGAFKELVYKITATSLNEIRENRWDREEHDPETQDTIPTISDDKKRVIRGLKSARNSEIIRLKKLQRQVNNYYEYLIHHAEDKHQFIFDTKTSIHTFMSRELYGSDTVFDCPTSVVFNKRTTSTTDIHLKPTFGKYQIDFQ